MAEHTSSEDEAPTKRPTRGATRLREVLIRRAKGQKTHVDINVDTGEPSGRSGDVFKSYLGMLARERISILTPSFDHVTEVDREMIWQDLLLTFDIPNVPTLRQKCLSSVAEKFRGFKTKLTSRYVFGHKKNENPLLNYTWIDEDTWRQFLELRTSEGWQVKRKKAQSISAQNTNPHILSRGGYRKLEEKIMTEKKKSRPPPSEGEDTEPPSPPSRHQKWKLARLRSSGNYTSDSAREISEKIDSLVEQTSQGGFIPEGRHDILAAAIGRPEHPGRVRGVGSGVGIRQFFGSSSRQSSCSHGADYEQRLKEMITAQVREELMRQFEHYGIRSPVDHPPELDPFVPPTGRSGKGSCSAPPGDDMDDTHPCQLYIWDGTEKTLVARGKVFEAATVLHGMELSEDEVKVTVEEVLMPHALVPMPTDEVYTVAQAFQCFLAWPRDLVDTDPPEKPQSKKILLSLDDPLGALLQLAEIIADKPMQVPWDANIFGRDLDIPLYLHSQDVLELAQGQEELNITIIQLWMMYLSGVTETMGLNDVYGFIDPQLTHEGNKFDDIQAYVTKCFQHGKEIYFVPYLAGRHWQLLVVSLRENLAVWFCSLHRPPPNHLRQVIDCSIAAHNMLLGRSTAKAKGLVWCSLQCNRKTGSYECGYYIMQWMTTTVRARITTNWETTFKSPAAIPAKSIKFGRIACAKYIIEMYNTID